MYNIHTHTSYTSNHTSQCTITHAQKKTKNAESRSGASSRLNTDDAVNGAISLVETTYIESFSHQSLGKDTSPMRMEKMRKSIQFVSPGKETVTMVFEWEMARR